jgi:hypothetical protein
LPLLADKQIDAFGRTVGVNAKFAPAIS